MGENGEIYTAGKKITLPPAVTFLELIQLIGWLELFLEGKESSTRMIKVFGLKKKLLIYFSFCVDQASTSPRTQLQTQQHFTGSSVRLQEHSTGESGEYFSFLVRL